MAMWTLWTRRNSIIFYDGSLSFAWWNRKFVEGMNAVTLRVKPLIKDRINLWLS